MSIDIITPFVQAPRKDIGSWVQPAKHDPTPFVMAPKHDIEPWVEPLGKRRRG